MKWLGKGQRGFTLIELLVALPIAALVVGAATGAIIQIMNSNRASNYMLAYRQVQTAGYWVSQDALQAQSVNVTAFLVLEWTDWNDDKYRISYTLEHMPSGGLKYLQREETIDGTTTRTTMAGQYLDADTTDCVWDEDEKMLTFTVEAQVGGQITTRTYEIKPRPLS